MDTLLAMAAEMSAASVAQSPGPSANFSSQSIVSSSSSSTPSESTSSSLLISTSSHSSANSSMAFSSPNTSTIPTTPSSPFFYVRPPPPIIEQGPEIFIYGFVLVLIPTATILGNFLVIISVLRFKALHSAINFLILGLAIADLMVALFVMPYAVYVYIQGGHWLLGPLMCNLYLSSDVACSTASIILLALISFDRYKAISKPIQYSRQAQDICRVAKLFVGVWVYSFAVASPIVLGFNELSAEESLFTPYECRFYNSHFLLLSSFVSFVLPCCVVIFVYVRIIRALRRREKAAKLRKAQQYLAAQQAGDYNSPRTECDEAGEIVAGPAVNMMMIALPSLNRQIKRYERHKRALEEVEGGVLDDDDLSSSESLSEDVRILTNDFLSEVPTSNSKNSNSLEPRGSFLISRFRASFSGLPRKKSSLVAADEIVPSIFAPPRKRSACDVGIFGPTFVGERRKSGAAVLRSRSNREDCRRDEDRQRSRLLPLKEEEKEKQNKEKEKEQQKEKADKKESNNIMESSNKKHNPVKPTRSFPLVRRITIGRDIRVNHYLLTGDESRQSSRAGSQKMRNGGENIKIDNDIEAAHNNQPKGKLQNGNLPMAASMALKMANLVPPLPFRRGSSAVELSLNGPTSSTTTTGMTLTTNTEAQTNITLLPTEDDSKLNRMAQIELANSIPTIGLKNALNKQRPEKEIKDVENAKMQRPPTSSGMDGEDGEECAEESGRQHLLQRSGGGASTGGGQLTTGGSRKDRHASLRRKVHKSQRKEKRATKTLGIVVGTFLCCWVPFFSLNIINAICLELRVQWCQVGFGPFFYTTWIGYMNSFMNPVIYTIFNAEFRRAFKSLLLGRRATAGVRRMI